MPDFNGAKFENTRLPLDQLKRYKHNSRTHSEEQIEEIMASMLEFGWTNPILVRAETMEIAAGHGRLEAGLRLTARGHVYFNEAPVILAYGWTDEQFRAYVIADNKIALDAGWDEEILRFELKSLEAAGYDMEKTGFRPEELDVLFAVGTKGLTDPDVAPPAPARPVTVPGDIWLLGNHRIACGSSTDKAMVEALLNGETPKLMVTDPPYGVEYDASWRVKAGVGGKGTATGKVANDDRADWREAWALFPGDIAYVWHGALHAGEVMQSLIAERFNLRAQIVWVKSRFVLSRGDYHWQHEPAWYATREGKPDGWVDEERYVAEHATAAYAVRNGGKSLWQGDRKQSTIWTIEHLKSNTGHSTQKPVECMKRPIENNSLPGHAVYEPFSGSGTTIIAAEMTGRRCFAMELMPEYVDVAVRRWEEFTGHNAMHDGLGRTFSEVQEERHA